ncbi:MAG: thioredoxin family protein [Desulfomonile tiedjei]|nr:thioredoxin family protein [Desulfomonile tiedjei]
MRRIVTFFIVCALAIAMFGLLSQASAAEPKINLQALLSKRAPILLEFGRGWCIPCKYMKPILEDMSKAYAGKAIVMTVDMDANKDLVRDFRIRMMPTQVFLTPDGKEFRRNEGTLEREQIMQLFSQMGVPAPGQPGAAQVPVPQAATPQGQPPLPAGAARR